MKKILKIVVLVVIFGGTVFLLIAANQKVNQQSMKSPVIDLTVQDGISLLTEKELLNELYTLRLFRDGLKKNELKIQEIEARSEEHTSELQSRPHLVCRLLLEKKKHPNNEYLYCHVQLD